MNATEDKIHSDVERYGWHVMNVLPERVAPGWAYSIGLFRKFGHPEIICFGLRGETIHRVINNAAEKISAGHAYSDQESDAELLNNYMCIIRSVHPAWLTATVGWGIWYYGNANFPLQQLF